MKLLLLFALTLPLAGDVTRSPGVTSCSSHPCTLAVTCPSSSCPSTDIQTAIDEAWLGDTITVQAGVTWTVRTPLILYRKTAGNGVVTIRTSTADELLPASGTRITPAYKALLPELRLWKSGTNLMVVEQTSNAVEHYAFMGIWFSADEGTDSGSELIRLWVSAATVSQTITNATNTKPIRISLRSTSGLANGDHVRVTGVIGNGGTGVDAAGANGWWTIANVTPTTVDLVGSASTMPYVRGGVLEKLVQWDASQTPNDITFDRCLFLTPALSGVRQALRLAGRNLTVKNSYCDEIKHQADSQCIAMPSTPGPVVITNNYLGGGPGETIITGGSIPTLPNQAATDITITQNALYKDPALYRCEAWAPGMWVRKGKVISSIVNNWGRCGGSGARFYIATASGVTGATPPAWPTAAGEPIADGSAAWQLNSFSSDKWGMKNLLEFKAANRVTVKWNTLEGAWVDGQTGLALSIKAENQGSAYDWTAHTEHIEFASNVIRNTAKFGIVINGGDNKLGVANDINIHDNLTYHLSGNGGEYYFNTAGSGYSPLTGLRIVHNTLERARDGMGFWLAGTGLGQYASPVVTDNLFDMSGTTLPVLCLACPSNLTRKAALDSISVGAYSFTKNVLAGENLPAWPAGNYDTAWGALGFNNPGEGDYRLPNRSPYRGAGTDGRDLGADTAQLPLIRNLTVSPTDRLAVFTWDLPAPLQEIPCVAEVSANRDFSTTVDDLDPARYARPDSSDNDRLPKEGASRAMIVGGNAPLANNTTYWYRLHCGGGLAHGSFTTTAPMTGDVRVSIVKENRPSDFSLEWGTAYSRETDAISGGGVVAASCAPRGLGRACSATITAPAGMAYYYRIRDAGQENTRQPVMVRAATRPAY